MAKEDGLVRATGALVVTIERAEIERRSSNGNKGGVQPLWKGDGKELFYLNGAGKVMAVGIRAGSELEAAPPQVLFATQLEPLWQLSEYAVTRDGQRFLFIEPAAQEITDSFNIILNWNAIVAR